MVVVLLQVKQGIEPNPGPFGEGVDRGCGSSGGVGVVQGNTRKRGREGLDGLDVGDSGEGSQHPRKRLKADEWDETEIKEWMKPERTDLFAYRPRRNNCT